MAVHRDERRRASRRQKIAVAVGFVVAALIVLIFPLVRVAIAAQEASDDLSAAGDAAQAGDEDAVRDAVARARGHVDKAQEGSQGIIPDLWGRTPVLGQSVADVRHLIAALDDVTSVAEMGADLYPSVAGDRATLFHDKKVDRDTLAEVVSGARKSTPLLEAAADEIGQVRGTAMFGGVITSRRDDASKQLTPLIDGLTQAQPLLDSLPAFLGFEGPRSYLVAIQNPAELRYSGGATLAFARMTWRDGTLDLQDAAPLVQDDRLRVPLTWPRVKGNPFHRPNTYLANSTFAPSWSVAGPELLRAWRSATDETYDGVLAVDVVAVAKVLAASGPTTVPGVGVVDGADLTKTLIGSYDDYYPDPTVQDQSSSSIVSAVLTQVFAGGNELAKAQALMSAGAGRHLSLFVKDPDVQAAFGSLDMDGNLSQPVGDYLGVFTQSLRAAKVDYYQRRHVALDVALDPDGFSRDRLNVLIDNDTPPYAVPGDDPHEGYFTRWSTLAASAFLPGKAKVRNFSVGGQEWDGRVGTFYDHSYLAQGTVVPPDKSTHLRASYRVPGAVTKGADGQLVYRLSVDPQGTVLPESLAVTVHIPEGFRSTYLPPGWTVQGSTLKIEVAALEASEHWTIVLAPA
ncbi:hypothetical protein ASC77_15275 [Nocardioides sp. Root1257]|uniref:DUF4012 domain-containing protein n=1 Tax=unclassified Nocardioides TaxID=2615069 RepID=UPI0006FF6EA8|nr:MULTISPECIES: DUF4012 domain-containing protein [unclassified Nocardioides]KQW47786.1 hypothetical protein ASC77_15275 [Nocardioides sp. Root1257]KRC45038.1 hypothetical protein ASE24_16225 [Nocardioides sp. Root224]